MSEQDSKLLPAAGAAVVIRDDPAARATADALYRRGYEDGLCAAKAWLESRAASRRADLESGRYKGAEKDRVYAAEAELVRVSDVLLLHCALPKRAPA
jgi:hypothetical protein